MKKVILAAFAAMGMVGSAFAVTAQSGIYIGALGGWSFADHPDQSHIGWNYPSVKTVYPITGTSDGSNRNYTYGFTLGYNYAITPNWLAGLEASYMNFGYNGYSSQASIQDPYANYSYVNFNGNAKIKSWGVQIMATGTYLMNNGFNIFGKLGAIDQRTTVDLSSNAVYAPQDPNPTSRPYSLNTSANKWLAAAAIGVGYMPIQNLNIALQYERTFGDNWNDESAFNSSNPKPMNQNAVTLGLTYNFAL